MTCHHRDLFILQLTDLHLMAQPGATLLGIDTEATFTTVLREALAGSTPDLLVLSGDLAQEPVPETYMRLLQRIQENYSGEVLLLPGNHDLSVAMTVAGIENRTFQQGGWAVIALDTHLDDQIPGHISDEELTRFKDTLENCRAEQVVVVGHHPLVNVGTPWLDEQKVDNAQDLLNIITVDARVKCYVFGHIHQAYDVCSNGLKMCGTPSTCFQFKAGSDSFSIDSERPGYRRLILENEGGIRTQVERLDNLPLEIDLSDRNY